jgi:hypothetical protein
MGQAGRSAKHASNPAHRDGDKGPSICVLIPTLRGTDPTVPIMPMRNKIEGYEPTGGGKSPEEYRRLAEYCREIARNVSAANDRADLLARAQTWDLIAERLGRAAPQAISGAAH